MSAITSQSTPQAHAFKKPLYRNFFNRNGGTSGDEDGRIVFRIQATPEHRGVKTGREGWGNEKKIVW